MKAIETEYNGYKFRSRLEARWAIFFDSLDIKYQYEVEGFELEAGRYLPDFWLPEWECWTEIKPRVPELSKRYDVGWRAIKRKEYRLCQQLAEHTGKVALLIGGQPWVKRAPIDGYFMYQPEYKIALFAPDMILDCSWQGQYSPNGICFNHLLHWYTRLDGISETFFSSTDCLYGFICQVYHDHPDYFDEPLPNRGDAKALVEADRIYFLKKYGAQHPKWYYGIANDNMIFTEENDRILVKYAIESSEPSERLYNAYRQARQARFEFREAA